MIRSSAETLAPLAATSLHHSSTGAVGHAMTKAVLASTTTVVGLERTLHGRPPGRRLTRRAARLGNGRRDWARPQASARCRRRNRVEPRTRFGNARLCSTRKQLPLALDRARGDMLPGLETAERLVQARGHFANPSNSMAVSTTDTEVGHTLPTELSTTVDIGTTEGRGNKS